MMSTYYAGLLADVGILLLGALSVYIILATGQLSLGNAGFMGIGAYLSSYLTVTLGIPLTLALVIAAVTAGAIGVIVGFPALRLNGIYLAMATLGFGEMVRSFFLNLSPMGASEGFHGMQHISNGYIWSWASAILLLVMILEHSQVWLEMRAVRDDETAAGSVGLNTTTVKVGAFGFAAAVAAVSGGLFAHHHLYIEPGNFSFERSIDFVLAVILGGSTVSIGALVGALLLVMLPEYLRFLAEWRFAAFGALLIAMLLVRRQGILDRSLFRAFALAEARMTGKRTAASGIVGGHQGVRRRPRARQRFARRAAKADCRHHRPQRRGEDHDIQYHNGRVPPDPGYGDAWRHRHQQRAIAPDRARGNFADVPEYPPVRGFDRVGASAGSPAAW